MCLKIRPRTVIKTAQSQTQTFLDVEASINIRDENQNLIWPIYPLLKASFRKPKYSPTLGGLGFNLPGLGMQLSAQEVKTDVLLILDAGFNMRAFSVGKPDAQPTLNYREIRNSFASAVLFHCRIITRWSFSFSALPDNLLVLSSPP